MSRQTKSDFIIILGIKISNISHSHIIKKIKNFLDSKQHYIVTPNPEIILAARQDEELFYILNNASLSIADGVGLKFAAWLMGVNLKRITGADLTQDILEIALKRNLRVAILNRQDGLSNREEIEKAIKRKYPSLEFKVFDIKKEEKVSNLNFLTSWKPHILFATLGAPYQEKTIYHSLKKFPFIKLGMGVGGSFDFLTGKAKRAPRFLRFLGLEWLWRLLWQPGRAKRIFRAVIVFPIVFFEWKFILPFFYRPNVVCILYKKEGDDYKILLVERKDEPGHWQLPQGGTDGESLAEAGSRELREELGTNKFKKVAIFPNLWQYEFGGKLSKFGVPAKSVWGYRGQKQSLFIAEFLGCDDDIKINFWEHRAWKWVRLQDLIKEAHPVRREAYKIYLNKSKQYLFS